MIASARRSRIEEFERRGFASWPAFETHELGGWELRAAGGLTGRSNSVQLLASEPATRAELDARIDRCEAFYRERGQPVRFKLTEAACPDGIDERLAELGYARRSPTRVQAAELGSVPLVPAGDVRIEVRCSGAWLEATARLNDVPADFRETWRGIVGRIERLICASVGVGGEIQAVGLGSLDDGWLFMGAIATAPQARGRGLARQLVTALLAHAAGCGAVGGWLQVTEDNEPGLALYRRLGFDDVYGYWYRVLD